MALSDADYAEMVAGSLAEFGVAVTLKHVTGSSPPALNTTTGKIDPSYTDFTVVMLAGEVRETLLGDVKKRVAYRDFYASRADIDALSGAPVIDRQDLIVLDSERWRIITRPALVAGKCVRYSTVMVVGKE